MGFYPLKRKNTIIRDRENAPALCVCVCMHVYVRV